MTVTITITVFNRNKFLVHTTLGCAQEVARIKLCAGVVRRPALQVVRAGVGSCAGGLCKGVVHMGPAQPGALTLCRYVRNVVRLEWHNSSGLCAGAILDLRKSSGLWGILFDCFFSMLSLLAFHAWHAWYSWYACVSLVFSVCVSVCLGL